MNIFYKFLSICAIATMTIACSKNNPDPEEPTPDLTSIDSFNALIFADYHSVIDTASADAYRLLYEAQATFTKCLDEYEGDPVMDKFYTVVELRYGEDLTTIVSHKIIHDCATGEKKVVTAYTAWMEDCFMPVVPPISLRDAYNILKKNDKMPHNSVVTLRKGILWGMEGELSFEYPQYIFGTSLYVDSMAGKITDLR